VAPADRFVPLPFRFGTIIEVFIVAIDDAVNETPTSLAGNTVPRVQYGMTLIESFAARPVSVSPARSSVRVLLLFAVTV
jgi:hypothetical protein